MATYDELYAELGNNFLIKKITIALLVSANKITQEGNAVVDHTARLAYAKLILLNPNSYAKPALNAIVTANSALSIADIRALSDVQIQGTIDAIINTLAVA